MGGGHVLCFQTQDLCSWTLNFHHVDRAAPGPHHNARCTYRDQHGKGDELKPTEQARWKYEHGPTAIKAPMSPHGASGPSAPRKRSRLAADRT